MAEVSTAEQTKAAKSQQTKYRNCLSSRMDHGGSKRTVEAQHTTQQSKCNPQNCSTYHTSPTHQFTNSGLPALSTSSLHVQVYDPPQRQYNKQRLPAFEIFVDAADYYLPFLAYSTHPRTTPGMDIGCNTIKLTALNLHLEASHCSIFHPKPIEDSNMQMYNDVSQSLSGIRSCSSPYHQEQKDATDSHSNLIF